MPATLSATPPPRLASGVTLSRPCSTEGHVLVLPGGQCLRLSNDMSDLVSDLDGHRDAAELAQRLGPPWNPSLVEQALTKLRNSGAVDDGLQPPGAPRRFRWTPPLTWTFSVHDPARIARVAASLLTLVLRPTVIMSVMTALLIGILLALPQVLPIWKSALTSALTPWQLLAVLGGGLAVTAIHELAHAATLSRYGGNPRRMGFMLVYFMPAFFCDVTSAWALSRRAHRVAVAAAGIVWQLFVVVLSVIFAGLTNGGLQTALLCFATAGFIQCVINAIPFVKFDGYVALATAIHRPGLRQHSMRSSDDAVRSLLFGGRRAIDASPGLILYGLMCRLTPLMILAVACGIWLPMVQAMGWVGAILASLIVFMLAWWTVRSTIRAVQKAGSCGAGPGRRILGVGVVVAALAALGSIPVSNTAQSTYSVSPEGGVSMTMPVGADAKDLQGAQSVTLSQQGLFGRSDLRSSHIADAEPEVRPSDLLAGMPVMSEGIWVPLPTVGLVADDELKPGDRGAATIDLGEQRAVMWVLDTMTAGKIR